MAFSEKSAKKKERQCANDNMCTSYCEEIFIKWNT